MTDARSNDMVITACRPDPCRLHALAAIALVHDRVGDLIRTGRSRHND